MNWQTVVAVAAGLFALSVAYDAWVARLERGGHDRGFLGFIVALGCGYTLAGAIPLIGVRAVMWVLLCFVASGTPMIVGSVVRYVKARELEQKRLTQVAAESLEAAEDPE